MANRFSNSRSLKNLALFFFLTLAYFVGTKLGLRLALVQPYAVPIWLPVGGALAAFLLFGYRVWPAVWVGSFLGHVSTLGFVSASFIFPVGATLEGLAGAYLVNKFAHGVKAFDTAKGVFLFVLFTSICAPSINATLGIATYYFGGRSNVAGSASLWLNWWLAHGISVLVVAPFVILLLRSSHHRLNLREFAELTAVLLGLIFLCLLVFGPLSHSLNKDQVVRVWLCVPFLIWAAFRFCPLEAAGTSLLLFGSAVWGTLHGYGSFVSRNLTTSLILLDTFVGVIGTTTLVVAAMVVERRRIEEELLGTQSLLQGALDGKGRDLALTAHALEMEVAGHAKTKKSLRDGQAQLQLLAENARLERKAREAQSHTERRK